MAIVVTNVIGVGVFMKARVMTCNVGTPELVLLAYLVAGIFTIAGALTFAELGAMMPRAGGQYNYLGAAFGRPWAFAYGWMATLIDGAASNAAIALGLIIFLNDFLGGTLSSTEIHLITAGIIVSVTVLALASVRANGFFATVVTALKVLLVAGVGMAAFWYSDGSWGHFSESGAAGSCEGVPAEARLGLVGFGAAIIGALWSYSGWSQVASIAEEVRRPGWTLPRALVGGCMIIIVLYLLINAGYFYVLSPETIASVPETSSVAGELLVRLIGAAGASLLTIGLMLCSFGALHSGTLIMSRVPYAMARDGLLPRTLASRFSAHPRADARDVAARRLRDRLCGFRHLRRDHGPHHLHPAAVQRPVRSVGLRPAPQVPERRASLPDVGLPRRAGALPRSDRLADDQHADGDARTGARRTRRRRARVSALLVLRAPLAAGAAGGLA